MYTNKCSRRRRSKLFSRVNTSWSSGTRSYTGYYSNAISSHRSSSSSSTSSASAGHCVKSTVSDHRAAAALPSSYRACGDIGIINERGGDVSQAAESSRPADAILKIRPGELVASSSSSAVPDDDKDPWPGSSSSFTRHNDDNGDYAVSLTSGYEEQDEEEEDYCYDAGEGREEEEAGVFYLQASSTMTNDDLCSGFEPQTWRKDRCKKCFRLKEHHTKTTTSPSGGEAAGSGSGASKQPAGYPTSSSNGNVAARVNKFTEKSGGVNGASARKSSIDNETTTASSSTGRNRRTPTGNAETVSLTIPRLSAAPSNNDPSTTMFNASGERKENASRGASSTSISASAEDSSTQKRKTKLVLIKTEVSFDGRPSTPVDFETAAVSTESATTPTSASPVPALSSKSGTAKRPISPQDNSVRSGASSGADSYETAPCEPALLDDPLSRTVSYESVASTLMEVGSMVTAASGRSNSLSERSSTPTESLDTDTHSFMRSIKAQLEIMENKCAKLEDENAKLRRRSSPSRSSIGGASSASSSSENDILQEKLAVAECLCQDYRDENTVLKCELRDLQELASRHGNYADTKEWRSKLKAAESLCEELMEENESLKTELQESRQEIDEMHDQYREEEIEEFRELQRELEQTAKNCRILQFKLRKSERRHDQTEADRQHLELKLKEFLTSGGLNMASATNLESTRLRELESELRIAKEVSVRLHNELEGLEEKRCKLEDENFYLKEKVRELETREKLMEQMRVRQELKRTGSNSSMGKPSHVTSGSNQNGQGDGNVLQLLRDLQDASERETDLREQLRFAEEDIQAARKKLADLETENEGLMRQLAKFTNTGLGGRGKPPMKRSFSEGHAQIELELAEHEATVLKDRLTRMEKDSEKMVSQISLLETEVKRFGGRTEFMEDELRSAIPDTYYKQKIKILEEEVEDLKKKLEDARRPESEQRLPPVNVSKTLRARTVPGSLPESSKNVDVQRQLSLVEQEVVVLRQRIADLEGDNERLSSENKSLHINSKKAARIEKSTSHTASSSSASNSDPQGRGRIEQMEKDIHRFISRIAELEKEKDVMNKEIDRRKKLDSIKREAMTISTSPSTKFNPNAATTDQLLAKVNDLINENAQLDSSLKLEHEKLSELESQLSDYKQVIVQSEDQKVVAMASKMNSLTNQLREAQSRIDLITYQKATGPAKTMTAAAPSAERKYEDMLKERIEILERALAEEKARNKTSAGLSKDGDTGDKELLAAELSNCHQMLSSFEDQVDRIYKQIEQLEQKQQGDKSPSTQPKVASYATRQAPSTSQLSGQAEREKVLKDISIMKSELDSLRRKLHDRRKTQSPSPVTLSKSPTPSEDKQLQHKCHQQEVLIAELKKQLEQANQERTAAQSHNETSTTRLLQTEERWNKELERLKESYEGQVKDLKYYLHEAERIKEENKIMLDDRSGLLQEKTRRAQELEGKVTKLEYELKTRHKDLQDRVEVEKKRAKEFETKYQKLETMYDSDRQKLNVEKEKFKCDLAEMKKRYEDSQNDFDKLKQTHDRKEQSWQKEKQGLQGEIKQLQSEVSEVEKKTAKKASEMASVENRKLLSEMSSLRRRLETDAEAWKSERTTLQHGLDQKSKDLEFRLDELERMKKEMDTLKARVIDQKQQLEEARRLRDESKEELNRWQQTWARERSELTHKLRQEEKVQQAEQQMLQQKYESRIKVMEDSAKRIQAQLSQTRRERDNARDSLSAAEKRIAEMRQKNESDDKELRQKILRMEKEIQAAEDVKVQLEKERVESKAVNKTYETDKRLWNVEREQFMLKISELEKLAGRTRPSGSPRATASGQRDEKGAALDEAVDIANELRKQLGDLKSSYDEEVMHLHKTIDTHRQEWSKERGEMQRRLKELQENMKIVDIDRRNLVSFKDRNETDRANLQSERDALMEKIHDCEIHQLANKYKLDKVADQIGDVQSRLRYGEISPNERREINDTIRKTLEQLLSVREDMAKTKELGKAYDSLDIPDDAASVASFRSSDGSRKMSMDIEGVEREAFLDASGKEQRRPSGGESDSRPPLKSYTGRVKTSEYLKPGPVSTRSSSGDTERSLRISMDKSRSASGDTGIEGRLVELRIRSPSPGPRKITNYPEAPPSMVLNTKTAVEYDSSGRRHWTRRSLLLKRSTSFDPYATIDAMESSCEMDSALDTSAKITQPRSASTGGDGGGFLCYKTPVSRENSDIGSDLESGRSQSPARRRLTNIFATMRRGTAAKAKRGLFGTKKSASIETSEVEHRIGAMGVQVLSPAITPCALPDSVTTASESSLDDPPKPLKKSTSGSSILAKLRNRSASRDPTKRQDKKTDVTVDTGQSSSMTTSAYQERISTKSVPAPSPTTSMSTSYTGQTPNVRSEKAPSTAGTSTATASKYRPTTEDASGLKIKDSLKNSRIQNTVAFRRLSSSYSSVRSLSSKYIHR